MLRCGLWPVTNLRFFVNECRNSGSSSLQGLSGTRGMRIHHTTSGQLNITNESSGGLKWPNATNYGLNAEHTDRARGATQGFLPQNLHGTHTSSAKSSGRRYVAAALLGDGHATWHLATSAEAVHRGLTMRSSDDICSPDAGVHYHSLERIVNPRSAASTLVARCHAARPSAAATYRLARLPLHSVELVWVP